MPTIVMKASAVGCRPICLTIVARKCHYLKSHLVMINYHVAFVGLGSTKHTFSKA